MITHSAIYWLTRLDSIKSMLSGFSIAIGICGVTLVIIGIIFKALCLDNMSLAGEEKAEKIHNTYISRHSWIFRNGVKLIITTFVLILINTMTPTMKEMAVIVVIPKVANSQPVHDIGEGIVNLAKEWMLELSPNAVSKKELANKVIDTAEAAVKTAEKVDNIINAESGEGK